MCQDKYVFKLEMHAKYALYSYCIYEVFIHTYMQHKK